MSKINKLPPVAFIWIFCIFALGIGRILGILVLICCSKFNAPYL